MAAAPPLMSSSGAGWLLPSHFMISSVVALPTMRPIDQMVTLLPHVHDANELFAAVQRAGEDDAVVGELDRCWRSRE